MKYSFVFRLKGKEKTIKAVAGDEYNALVTALLNNHYVVNPQTLGNWVLESKTDINKPVTLDSCKDDFTTFFIEESKSFSASIAELRKVYNDSVILEALNAVLGDVTWE